MNVHRSTYIYIYIMNYNFNTCSIHLTLDVLACVDSLRSPLHLYFILLPSRCGLFCILSQNISKLSYVLKIYDIYIHIVHDGFRFLNKKHQLLGRLNVSMVLKQIHECLRYFKYRNMCWALLAWKDLNWWNSNIILERQKKENRCFSIVLNHPSTWKDGIFQKKSNGTSNLQFSKVMCWFEGRSRVVPKII